MQANAETLPFADESFDAVVCVYLFHEMPEEARRRAALEMCRVIAPGGTVVLTDSMQKGDRPVLDDLLGNFGKLNEPHYANYIETDLSALFEEGGLVCDRKFASQAWSLPSKPLAETSMVEEEATAAVDVEEAETEAETPQVVAEADQDEPADDQD